MTDLNLICRCEAKRNKGSFCQLCMGSKCWNQTYEFNGEIYNLVDATLLWSTGSYDGPMSGIACYKGLACYAVSYTHMRHRSYWLYPLRHTEWVDELCAHTRYLHGDFVGYLSLGGYERYKKRKPLGFFRINYGKDPLKTNALGDSYRQIYYQHYFKYEDENESD